MVNSTSSVPFVQEHFGGSKKGLNRTQSYLLLSAVLAFLPVVSGIIFRSYGYGVYPVWLEHFRMIDFPDVVAEALVILWARHRGMDFAHYWRALPKHLKVAGAVFLSTFWIGAVLFSPIAAISIIRSGYWLIHLGFGFAVYHLITSGSKSSDVKHYVNWQLAGVAVLTIITALHLGYMTQLPASYADQIKWAGAIPGCMSSRHFGILTGSIAALYTGYYCWTAPPQYRRWIAVTICTLLIGLTAWSGTRAAAAGFVGAFVILAIATKQLPTISRLSVVCISIILGIILSAQILPPDSSFGFFRLFDGTHSTVDELSSGRIVVWQFVWNLFLDHWALGWGEGAMHGIEIPEIGGRHIQPHNAVFQFLYSWGIFAATAMFVIIGSVMLRLHKKVASNLALAAPLMMADALLIMSLFDGTLFFARMIMPLVFCLALCFALDKKGGDPAVA